MNNTFSKQKQCCVEYVAFSPHIHLTAYHMISWNIKITPWAYRLDGRLTPMNRTDRLLAIVLELQRKGQQRAEELAVTFEVSKRTLYRDMQALSEAGVPIIAIQKKGYSLSEGYFLPPLRFTTEEALILALGSDFMGHTFDDQYRLAAEAASRKIDAVLPETLRQEVSYL